MKVKISYTPNLSEVKEIDLTSESTTRGEWAIGRSPDSDILLDSPDVSRLHAKFFVKGESYYFTDLGSRNGSIVNGKQAEKERPYLLNDGDIIRIADYVLILEAVAPLSEQLPETVFRIIDPSLFSRPRATENVSNPVINPVPEVASEIPQVNHEPSKVETPEISEVAPVAFTQHNDVVLSAQASTSENIIQPPVVANEASEAILGRPVAADVSADIGEVLHPEVVSSVAPEFDDVSAVSFTQPDNFIPKSITQPLEEEHSVPQVVSNETTDDLEAEATFVQPRDTSVNQTPEGEHAVSEALSNEIAEFEAALEAEATFVQPRDILANQPQKESVVAEEANRVEEDTDIQPWEESSQAPKEESRVSEAVNHELVATFDVKTVGEVEAPSEEKELSEEAASAHDTTQPQEDVVEVFSNQYVDLSNTSTQEVIEDSEAPELISQIDEEVSQTEESQSEDLEATNVNELNEPPQVIIQRNIVLIAHETKKSELAEFVAQHQEFFSESFTITWPSVSEVLQQEVGLTVSQQIPAATSGGYQTIAAQVGSGDILAVIFLRDFLQPQSGQANEEALLRLCNINQVLLATNLPTAEALVHYIKHIA